MSYRLYYFPFRGRGEQIRLLLHALEVSFEEVGVDREGFAALRAEQPTRLAFGALPMLEDGDLRLVQGPAIMAYIGREHGAAPGPARDLARADAITLGAEDLRMKYFGLFGDGAEKKQREFLDGIWKTRWLPAFERLLEANESDEHFVGSTLTYADVAVWDVFDAIVTYVEGAGFDGAPRMRGFYDAFATRPAVAKYLGERPEG